MIFLGYPAKIAEWIGSGATYAIAAIINNVDLLKLYKVSAKSLLFIIYLQMGHKYLLNR